jgi:hypothetical protein
VGQPVRQCHEFLNCFFIQLFVFQENPHINVAVAVAIGRQCRGICLGWFHSQNSHPAAFQIASNSRLISLSRALASFLVRRGNLPPSVMKSRAGS